MVTKLDRLARFIAREILADLTSRQVKLSFAGTVHDPTDPVGRLFGVTPSTVYRAIQRAARHRALECLLVPQP